MIATYSQMENHQNKCGLTQHVSRGWKKASRHPVTPPRWLNFFTVSWKATNWSSLCASYTTRDCWRNGPSRPPGSGLFCRPRSSTSGSRSKSRAQKFWAAFCLPSKPSATPPPRSWLRAVSEWSQSMTRKWWRKHCWTNRFRFFRKLASNSSQYFPFFFCLHFLENSQILFQFDLLSAQWNSTELENGTISFINYCGKFRSKSSFPLFKSTWLFIQNNVLHTTWKCTIDWLIDPLIDFSRATAALWRSLGSVPAFASVLLFHCIETLRSTPCYAEVHLHARCVSLPILQSLAVLVELFQSSNNTELLQANFADIAPILVVITAAMVGAQPSRLPQFAVTADQTGADSEWKGIYKVVPSRKPIPHTFSSSKKFPKNFQKNSKKNSKKIPKKFQKNSKKNSRKFQKNSGIFQMKKRSTLTEQYHGDIESVRI